MLRLVSDAKAKKETLARLKDRLKGELENKGNRNIGFPGGNFNRTIYSAADGNLWAAFGPASSEEHRVARYWNGFGVFNSSGTSQTIVVEINIPSETNSEQVAGFFAEDGISGDVFLMHSGKVGGGRPGIGKKAFLAWTKLKTTEVVDSRGSVRTGIAIARLEDSDLADRIWQFVKTVDSFKKLAASGELDTPDFEHKIKEFDSYNKEFSGAKSVRKREEEFKYITYHGEVVQKLYAERIGSLATGEDVFNSTLVDLYVKKNGTLSEVYEVKTGIGRQMLYCAIGQLLTHAYVDGVKVRKFLVVPEGEDIPGDVARAIKALEINVRRFRLIGNKDKRIIELV